MFTNFGILYDKDNLGKYKSVFKIRQNIYMSPITEFYRVYKFDFCVERESKREILQIDSWLVITRFGEKDTDDTVLPFLNEVEEWKIFRPVMRETISQMFQSYRSFDDSSFYCPSEWLVFHGWKEEWDKEAFLKEIEKRRKAQFVSYIGDKLDSERFETLSKLTGSSETESLNEDTFIEDMSVLDQLKRRFDQGRVLTVYIQEYKDGKFTFEDFVHWSKEFH
jgi:hypothetical protein